MCNTKLTFVAKTVAEYVPESVSDKIPGLGNKQVNLPKDEPKEEPKEDLSAVPPHRPHHDDQIQEFLRDQHRSKEILGDDEDTKDI